MTAFVNFNRNPLVSFNIDPILKRSSFFFFFQKRESKRESKKRVVEREKADVKCILYRNTHDLNTI